MSRSSGTTRRRRRHGQPAACGAKRYAICGIENHGFRGVTNGNKKLASNAKRYPLCENKRIPFTRSPPVFAKWVPLCIACRFLAPRSYPRISPLPILQSGQGVLASFQEIIAKIACVQRKDTAYFLRLIQLVSMLYDCRNIIALCALKTNITQNMGRPHCAATLILILL